MNETTSPGGTTVADLRVSDVVLDLVLLFERDGNDLHVDGIDYYLESISAANGTLRLRIVDDNDSERHFELDVREVSR